MAQTTPFTAAELTAIRRFCGYPAYAAFGYSFAPDMATLDTQLADMSDAEQAVVRTVYLTVLPQLETNLYGTGFGDGDNLDTQSAAVWFHNPNEIADRKRLFNEARRALCGHCGCEPGPALGRSGTLIRA